MLTYAAVLVVVLLVLLMSFRALGGGAGVTAEDYATVLARLGELTTARAQELDAALASADEPPARSPTSARPADDPLVAVAAAARKRLGGYHQQLARLEPTDAGDDAERLQTIRSLLTAAVEDVAWACRLVEGGTYRENPGIQEAVDRLRLHARRCLDAVSAGGPAVVALEAAAPRP